MTIDVRHFLEITERVSVFEGRDMDNEPVYDHREEVMAIERYTVTTSDTDGHRYRYEVVECEDHEGWFVRRKMDLSEMSRNKTTNQTERQAAETSGRTSTKEVREALAEHGIEVIN
jgi:predicted SPOUT superfamily RNA methylase MTH1